MPRIAITTTPVPTNPPDAVKEATDAAVERARERSERLRVDDVQRAQERAERVIENAEPEPETETDESETKEEEVKGLAASIAKSVQVEAAPDPDKRPDLVLPSSPEMREVLDTIQPGDNHPQILQIRVTNDDGRSMEEFIEDVRDALSDCKTTTILLQHRLVGGRLVAEHHYQTAAKEQQ